MNWTKEENKNHHLSPKRPPPHIQHCLKDNQCKDPSVPFQLYQAKNYTHLFDVLSLKTTCERIMEHIMNVGPVQAGFLVFEDFMAYSSGVYHYVSGRLVGAHAVKVVGWGEENGDPYWLVGLSPTCTFLCHTHTLSLFLCPPLPWLFCGVLMVSVVMCVHPLCPRSQLVGNQLGLVGILQDRPLRRGMWL